MAIRDKTQLNVPVPRDWKLQLEAIARQKAVMENRNITQMDIVREALRDVFNLQGSIYDDEEEEYF